MQEYNHRGKKFLIVDKIDLDNFYQIEDRNDQNNIKPVGGLWLTEYDESITNYSLWLDFMLEKKYLFFQKSKNQDDPWNRPCILVTLKENARIFNLDSKEKYDYLLKKYPLNENAFSYEKLKEEYDGIYVNLFEIIKSTNDYKTKQQFNTYGVNSLSLFNDKCIEYYQKGNIEIERFDPDDFSFFDYYYKIKINKEKNKPNSKVKILKRN